MTATTESARQPDDCRVSPIGTGNPAAAGRRDESCTARRALPPIAVLPRLVLRHGGMGRWSGSICSKYVVPQNRAVVWRASAGLADYRFHPLAGHVTGRALRRSTAARRGAPACSSAANTASWRCQGNHRLSGLRKVKGIVREARLGGSHGRRLQVRCIPSRADGGEWPDRRAGCVRTVVASGRCEGGGTRCGRRL